MNQAKKYIEVDIRELFGLMLKKSWIMLICILLTSGLTAYYSYTRLADFYSASATVYLGKETMSGSIDLGMITLSNQLMSDLIGLTRSRAVADEVVNRMGTNIPAEFIQKGISAYMPADQKNPTRMLVVSFQSTNPQFCADVVNHVCDAVIEKAEEIFGLKNVQIIDRALVPQYPIGPNRTKNILIAAAAGLLFGIVIIFLMEFKNYSFKKPEDVERILELDVLGVIPLFKGDKR